MAFSGLLALLDDIATIADDVASLTALAAKKTAGLVTDDMAVTAEQAVGIPREREIPVVLAVARGSLINKCVYLTPGALLLNAVAPWAILPILMVGGAYLSFEGVEKILHARAGHGEEEGAGSEASEGPLDPAAFEAERISGAVRTDLILSAEIVAISLGQVAEAPFLTQAITLYIVAVLMTVGVYGIVGVLVKLDDAGEALALQGGGRAALGRAIVRGTPGLLHGISVIGTVAMLVVGGHILREGIPPLEHALHALLAPLSGALGAAAGMAADIAVGGLAGLLIVGLSKTGVHTRIARIFRRKKKA